MRRSAHLLVATVATALLLALTAGCAGWWPQRRLPAEPASQMAELRRILAGDPRDGEALLAAARLALLDLDQRAEARALLERAVALPAQRRPALLLLAYAALAERDYPGLLRWGSPLLDELPGEPEAELALWMLRYAEGNHPGYEEQVVPRLQRLLASAVTGGELRWQAALLLVEACGRRKDEACWDAQIGESGAVLTWRGAGPYGIAPAHDFPAVLPEEQSGLPASCHPPAPPATVDEVCPQELFARDGQVYCPQWTAHGGTCLLETWVRTPASSSARLRAITGAALRVVLDGRTVLERDAFSRHEPAYLGRTVSLAPGWHRLQVKLSASGYGRGFRLFLSDAQGRPLVGEVDPGPEPPAAQPAGAGPATGPPDGSARSWLEAAAARGDADAQLFLATFLGDFPFQDPAALLAHARALASRFPGAAEAHFLLGEALRQHPDLGTRLRRSLARQEYVAALAQDRGHLMAHFRLGVLELDDDSPDAALEHFDACVRLAPAYPWGYQRRFQLFRQLGWDREARQDLERAAALSPSVAVARELEAYWSELGAVERRDEARRRLLAATAAPAPSEVARWAEEAGEPERAIGLWEATGRFDTLGTLPVEEVVRLSRALGDRETRDRALEEWARRDPTDADLADARARALLADGRLEDGIAALRQLLFRHPERFTGQRLLAELQGRALAPAAPDARMLLAEHRRAQQDDARRRAWDESDMIIIWEARDDLLTGRGAGLRVVHRISLVQTKQAADALGEKRIPADGVLLEFRTIKADGQILQPELGQGKGDLSFSGVGIGDMVEYRYVLPLRPTLVGGGFFDRFFFAFPDRPIHGARLQVCVPRGETLQIRGHGFSGSHDRFDRPDDDRDCHRFAVQGVEAIEAEPWSTPFPEWLPWIGYGYRLPERSREETVLLLGDRLLQGRRSSLELGAALRQILAGRQPPPAGAEELARRLYGWVRDEVRSGGGESALSPSATVTLAERKGCRTLLLSALLAEASVAHRLLLARSRAQEQLDPPLPDLGWFAWPLIEVPLPAAPSLLLDLVSDEAPAGYVPPALHGAQAMVLASFGAAPTPVPAVGELVVLAPAAQAPGDRWLLELDLRLAEDGQVSGTVV
ncbi:MAG: hypothetical protein FJ125_02245, partial [Deltaproteobacteria bacterium]|nr:hypothetical protein [Deltaproteobacteria bacterium]